MTTDPDKLLAQAIEGIQARAAGGCTCRSNTIACSLHAEESLA